MQEENVCKRCQESEVAKLKSDLMLCRKQHETKDRKIKSLDKKVFILTFIVVGVGAIFGKEAVDTIIEWLGKIGEVKTGVDNLHGAIVPPPSSLAVFGMFALMSRRSRRRK